MAEGLPVTARRLRLPLESAATRLERASDGLSNELRADVDIGSTRLLVRFARRAMVVGAAGIVLVGPGVAEGIVTPVTEHVIQRQAETEQSLHRLEERLDDVEALPPSEVPDESAVSAPEVRDTRYYSGKEAAEIVGISYRQLDYWVRTDLVDASVADASGSGSRRQFSRQDLIELKIVKSMLDAGIKLDSVRVAFEYLREQLGDDISEARLVIGGGKAILVRSDEELLDVVGSGQLVMTSLLSVGGVAAEVDAGIRSVVGGTSTAPLGGAS